jgi:hypothetical protein
MQKVQALVSLCLTKFGGPIGARYQGRLRAATIALLFEGQGHPSRIFIKEGPAGNGIRRRFRDIFGTSRPGAVSTAKLNHLTGYAFHLKTTASAYLRQRLGRASIRVPFGHVSQLLWVAPVGSSNTPRVGLAPGGHRNDTRPTEAGFLWLKLAEGV